MQPRSSLLCALLCAGLVLVASQARANGYALVVGIDHYAQPGISVLEGAENDARAMADTLEQALGIPRKNILLYTSSGDQKPTTGTIVKGLKYIAAQAGPDDVFVLAFSGHGASAAGESYLLTFYSEMGALRDTALPVNRVSELVGAVKSRRKLLVLDACRNDPEKGKGDRENLLTADFARGLAITPDKATKDAVAATLFSCEVGQRSYEMPGRKRGFFSWHLEQGLKGKAADDQGRVSLGRLVSYLRKAVPDDLARSMGVDRQQTPYAVMEGGDPANWVLNLMGGKDWDKELAQRQQEMERLKQMEAGQAAARQQQSVEEERFKGRISDLDARIAAMKSRLGTGGAGSGDSLDAMLVMVEDKEAQERELEALRQKRLQEEAARTAELERLEREKVERSRKAFEGDYAKYRKIAESKYGKDMADAALRELKAKYPGRFKEPWTDPATGMEFVWVPGGCFQMGSNDGESDEKPVHEVCVDGFWMGKYEVAQAQWRAVTGSNPSNFKGDDLPVEQVSWNDTQEFIRKLNGLGNGTFRLPTEAEWEYACRSGGMGETYVGGNDVDRVAWYGANSGDKMHPVGTKAPNGLGLYDMSGNVWEWVQDWYDSGYYGKSPRQNPTGPGGGSNRVIRGGSWDCGPALVRSAFRNRYDPGHRYNNLGFRLTRTD